MKFKSGIKCDLKAIDGQFSFYEKALEEYEELLYEMGNYLIEGDMDETPFEIFKQKWLRKCEAVL